MSQTIEEKIVFAIGDSDGVPIVIVGIPKGAWEYMKDGKTHHFDLTRAGLPIKFMLYGASDHAAAMKAIEDAMAAAGAALLDCRREDWGIKDRGPQS